MPTDTLKLLLPELEVEVVQEALELYLRARPRPADPRFEYRYRAAQSVLDSLQRGGRALGTFPLGDDEATTVRNEERPAPRPRREQLED